MSRFGENKYTIEPNMALEDTYRIDFVVRDSDDDIVATVWGWSFDTVEIDCEHPEAEFGDKDECGFCPICGAECIWHEEEIEDGKDRVIDSWSTPLIQDCLIKEEIQDVKDL